jgi:hypothetical protein
MANAAEKPEDKSSMPFEILNSALMASGGGAVGKGAQVAAVSGFWICFPRV